MEHLWIPEYDESIQNLRKTEFPQLSSKSSTPHHFVMERAETDSNSVDTTYLDHAGTTLYPASLIDSVAADLKSNLYGNPHSASPASHLSTLRVGIARAAILDYFNASPQDFEVVFVANATAAIKLVAQCFAQQGFHYAYHRDGHTSLVGVREIASSTRFFESDEQVDQWIREGASIITSEHTITQQDLQLFAYPAQSNMNGHRPSLKWCGEIRAANSNVYTLLDAASYLTTGRLDLSEVSTAPDYIALSFYKIFGFPDLGALIIRKPAASVLTSRAYFGGGTVDMVIATTCESDVWHATKSHSIHEQLEDGTLPFHSILTISHALRYHQQFFGSAQSIRTHVGALASWAYDQLKNLRHFNGSSAVELYTDAKLAYADPSTQGPIMTFNLRSSKGTYIGKSVVEAAAIACGIQLRTGGVCNPGGIATSLHLQPWEMRRNFAEGMRCGDDLDVLGGKPTGIVRISLGPMSTMADVMVFKDFINDWFVEKIPVYKVSSVVDNRKNSWIACLQVHGFNHISELLHSNKEHVSEGAGNLLHSQQTTPDFSNQQGSIFVAPIMGVSATQLVTSPSRSSHLTVDSVASWQHEWVLVNSKTMQIVPPQIISNAELSATIWPEQGQLRIQSPRISDELFIDLWTTPRVSLSTGSAVLSSCSAPPTTTIETSLGPRTADLYQSTDISAFFTLALDGYPCTLARFRSRYANNVPNTIGLETTVSEGLSDLQHGPNLASKSETLSSPVRRTSILPQTLKCVHVDCNHHFDLSCNKAEMQREQNLHFTGHARDFERLLRTKGLGRPNLHLPEDETRSKDDRHDHEHPPHHHHNHQSITSALSSTTKADTTVDGNPKQKTMLVGEQYPSTESLKCHQHEGTRLGTQNQNLDQARNQSGKQNQEPDRGLPERRKQRAKSRFMALFRT